jgi:translation initiation factor IF-2
VLVQSGTLQVGDIVVTGSAFGKVKAMFDDRGNLLKKAGPSTPAKVIGLNTVPQAGDSLVVVPNEHQARTIVEQRLVSQQQQAGATRGFTLSAISSKIRQGETKTLNIILKTDVQGSIEPILSTLNQIKAEGVKVNVVHAGTGSITEGDVLLALASNGIIVGFNERPEPGAKRLAEVEGVDIRNYDIIYSLTDDIEKAMHGMLEPRFEDVVDGHAEVRAIFSAKGSKVAGIYVTSGKARRTSQARVIRGGKIICQSSEVSSLRHFKEDIREAAAGLECGVTLQSCNDFAVGDIIEFYHSEKVAG